MRGVSKRFGPTVALESVDLDVAAGEVHALVGENGAGKSTLMKILAGALAHDAGTMTLDGAPYSPRSPAAARAAGVAMIFQELSLAPHLTVAENVSLGAEPCVGPFVARRALRETARAALATIGRGDLQVDARVSELGPAERQMVEVARAVALGSRVLVLDEPTSSLAHDDVERLFALIRDLRARGTAIIYISHALEEVFALADRYTVLRDGAVTERGATAATDPTRMVAAMVGRSVDELFPRSPATPGEVVLSTRGLAGSKLPRAADLEVRRGEVVGIAGLVGAGRTEFLRALFGLDAIASGEVVLHGVAGPRSPRERWSDRVGLVSEDRAQEGLALDLSIADNLCMPRLARFATRARVEADARPWLERLAVKQRAPSQRVRELSGGNQQKIAIARLLAAEADVLLLDEPTRGIDVGSKAEIYRWIDRLARGPDVAERRAVLIVSSVLPELLGLCDRIAVMTRGRLGPARPARELDEHRLLLDATGVAP